MNLSPYPVKRQDFQGYSITEFDARASSVVIGFKDQGRTALKSWMAGQMLKALNHLDSASLVCLPTSRAAYVRRGYRANHLLTKELARQSRSSYLEGALEFSRQLMDQRALRASERLANLQHSMVGRGQIRQAEVILVDDVLTTGASLLEARRAVEAAGGVVKGFIVFAETLRRT